jgi:Spondin_N
MNWSRLVRSRKFNALTLVAFAVALLLVIALPGKIGRSSDDVKTWNVTWTNIATGFQPLTPPILIVHQNNKPHIWDVGEPAIATLADLAQDPNAGPMKAQFQNNPDVSQAVIGFPGMPTLPGNSRSVQIQTSGSFDRLDFLSMLANTNDTFTGLSNYHVTGNDTIDVYAYDAGTEANNEKIAYIPGPCCGHPFVTDATSETGELIHPQVDGGILGVGDLSPATYAWHGAVARITITQVG